MFKKVKYSDGRREFYLFGKKIFQYVNQSRFADFMKNRLDGVAYSLSSIFDTNKMVNNQKMGGGGKLLCF